MDPVRFDHITKRFAARRLSRRYAIRGLGAAGLAGALFSVRREHAAADCPDISICSGPCGPSGGCNPRFALPGGPVGACWDGFIGCNPCHTTWDALKAICNQANAQCGGECYASFPF